MINRWQRLKKPETESESKDNELEESEDKEDGDPGDWGSRPEDKEEMSWSFSKGSSHSLSVLEFASPMSRLSVFFYPRDS